MDTILNSPRKVNDRYDIVKRIQEALSAVDFARSLCQDHVIENNILAIQKLSEIAKKAEIYETTDVILKFIEKEKNDLQSLHNQARLDHYLQSLRHSVDVEK